MLLTPEVLSLLIINFIFAFFAIIAFFLAIKIFLSWDIHSTSQKQYKLEKQSFLMATIVKYIFILKLPLFLFFIFTLDKISNVLTGAMCAAGVVDATPYGLYLFLLKIFNLYVFAYWLVLHYKDIHNENLPFTKDKALLYLGGFAFLMTEIVVEFLMFNDIDIDKMVSCCGTLYSASATSYISNIFTLSTPLLLGSFYIIFFLMIGSYIIKNRYLFGILNFLFIFVSIVSLIVFFGTYIYQLPTHHCPFCMLQKDYNYIGYFLYTFLFIGTFYGTVVLFMKKYDAYYYRISLGANSFFVAIVSYYPVVYYLTNGVFL